MKLLPDHRLTVVGGRPEQIARLKADAGTNVEFTGYQPRTELRKHLAKAGVALIPNRLEPKSSLYSFPMKLVEYAAAGRLVVASDLPVLRELNPGNWISLIQPENPEALAAGIRSFATAECRSLQGSAREWATAFTWAAQAKRIVDFLGNVQAPTR